MKGRGGGLVCRDGFDRASFDMSVSFHNRCKGSTRRLWGCDKMSEFNEIESMESMETIGKPPFSPCNWIG